MGSTKVDLCHREYNRMTQVKRFESRKAIQIELAIRWWSSQGNYSHFTTIAIQSFSTYAEAWTFNNFQHHSISPPSLQLQTWRIMYDLSSFSKQRFETSKWLGSGACTDTMVYSYIRLSRYVEEPERSRIRGELKRVATFRNMTWPRTQHRPLQTPFLAHHQFLNTPNAG